MDAQPEVAPTAPLPTPVIERVDETAESLMLTWSTMLWRRSRLQDRVTYGQVMEAEGVVFDGPRRRVLVDGYLVHLPAREAAVLGVLMMRPGQLVYRPALVNAG